MKVNFITPSKISLIDITSMGDSSKRGDDSTIGQFDSGLKYAIAILLRHDVSLSIIVQGEPKVHETYDEPTTETYRFGTYIETCENTGKTKELIHVECENTPHGGAPMNQHDMREPSMPETWNIKTGFAKAMGYNWELWMALRELWSNMLDEKGSIGNYYPEDGIEGTVMTLEFDEDSEFYQVWENRHLYINEKEPVFSISPKVDVLNNDEGYIRIYKQNILVYKDEDVPSRFSYNIKFGDIDERRILSNIWSVKNSIAEAIIRTDNESYLREIISYDFSLAEKDFLSHVSIYYNATDLHHNIAVEVFNKHGQVNSYPWLMAIIRKRKDCGINGKTIQSVSDHMYSYSTEVKIESKPVPVVEEKDDVTGEISFSEKVSKLYNINVDVPVKTAKLRGSKVIADKYEKCIIIDESFSIEENMAEFIVQYIDLTKEGNLLTNLSEYLISLLRK